MRIEMHRAMIASMTLVLAVMAGQAQASLLAVDTFNYTAGAAVDGLNGGTGWGGAWTSDVPWSVTSPGLTVASLKIASPDNAVACNSSTTVNKTISRPLSSAQTNGVRYLGVLLRYNSGSEQGGYVSVVNGTSWGFKIGWSIKGGYWNITGGGSGANSWGTTVNTTIPVVAGQAVLAVVKVNIDTKAISLYINQATEGTPDATTTASRFGMLSVSSRMNNGGTSNVDDIRIGTTYADVAAIPIPKRTLITIR